MVSCELISVAVSFELPEAVEAAPVPVPESVHAPLLSTTRPKQRWRAKSSHDCLICGAKFLYESKVCSSMEGLVLSATAATPLSRPHEGAAALW
jgi:hypothetical protein